MARISLKLRDSYELAVFRAVFPSAASATLEQHDSHECKEDDHERLRDARAKFVSDLSIDAGIAIAPRTFSEIVDAAHSYVSTARQPSKLIKAGRNNMRSAKKDVETLRQATEAFDEALRRVEERMKSPLLSGDIVPPPGSDGIITDIAADLDDLLSQSLLGRSLYRHIGSLETTNTMHRAFGDLDARLARLLATWDGRYGVTAARPAHSHRRDFLTQLHQIYVAAGGKDSAGWNAASGTPTGGLGRFIVSVHGALPADVRAGTSDQALIKAFRRAVVQAPLASDKGQDKTR